MPLAAALLVAFGLFLWFWNLKPLYLNEKITRAHMLAKAGQCPKALAIAGSSDWSNAGIVASYAGVTHAEIIQRCAFAQPEREIEYLARALGQLRISTTLQPDFARAWAFRGAFATVLAEREENPERQQLLLTEAKDVLLKAVALSPGRQEFFIELGKHYMVAEDYQAMKASSQDCIAIDPEQGPCYWYLGIAEILLGNQENGERHIAESWAKHYNDPPYLQLGVAYARQKNHKGSAEVFEKLVAIHPDNALYSIHLAYAYHAMGEIEAGADAMKTAFFLQPGRPEIMPFINQLIKAYPDNVHVRYALADLHKALGDREAYRQDLVGIIAICQRLVIKNPADRSSRFAMAYAYKELGEIYHARKQVLQAFISGSDAARHVASLLEEESSDDAYETIKRITLRLPLAAKHPEDDRNYLFLAVDYQKLGVNEEAVEYAMKAFRLNPGWKHQVQELLRAIPTEPAKKFLGQMGAQEPH